MVSEQKALNNLTMLQSKPYKIIEASFNNACVMLLGFQSFNFILIFTVNFN